jgi:hypothetical protein
MADHQSRRFKRCFVSGPQGVETQTLTKMLVERGIDVTTPWIAKPTAMISQEILGLIAEADFMACVIGPGRNEHVMYELGVARSLGKPAFIVLAGASLPLDISGIYVHAVDPGKIAEARDDLDRFLRNAKAPPPISAEPLSGKAVDLNWARKELTNIRSGGVNARGPIFEYLVQRIFEAAGAEVTPTDQAGQDGRGEIDFIVWLNEVVFDVGGPILVECKVLRGGSGSVIKNAEAYVHRLAKAVNETDASLALLIFDHDRPHTPPSLFETPQVLSIAIEDLLDGLEKGTLEADMLRRRRRASFVRGSGA